MQDYYKNSYKAKARDLVSLSVYNVGCQKCDALYQWGPGVRDHYLIHYIVSGKGTYRYLKQSVSLGKGDCFLVYPGEEITYYADPAEPWEYAWVGFAGGDAPILLEAAGFSRNTPYLRSLSYGDKIHRQILQIYDVRGNELEHTVEMTGRLYTMLSAFLKASPKPSVNTYNSYVQKAIEYISANYSYAIRIEDIAAYVGLSRSHLFRSFQSMLGKSPKEYLTEFRIKQSCYLLENSSLSVKAIANSVGFDNSLYFSKTFRTYKNQSPVGYRKSRLLT